MDICTVLQQVKALTGALPEIYSEELSEDDWWHKAMGCHFHACPFGSHCRQGGVMILNSFCIIVLSAAILMNSFTQSCHTKSIRALNDKLADLRLRFNSSRGKEEKIHAEKIRKENKDSKRSR